MMVVEQSSRKRGRMMREALKDWMMESGPDDHG